MARTAPPRSATRPPSSRWLLAGAAVPATVLTVRAARIWRARLVELAEHRLITARLRAENAAPRHQVGDLESQLTTAMEIVMGSEDAEDLAEQDSLEDAARAAEDAQVHWLESIPVMDHEPSGGPE